MTDGNSRVDELGVNTLRFLAVDAVEAAGSGHPGLPLGAAPMAYVVWDRFLQHSPRNPSWFNRDRFVLSAGHGSALLYALLHAYGYDLPLDELKRFRQWGSKTPGHPEYGLTPGVEATTGPLGQGFANAIGMAIAERFLAATFNEDGHSVVDHFTYTIASDGDLMEGVGAESASLAGQLGVGKLICLYDDNKISLAGPTDLTFREDVGARFEAYGWQVLEVTDGNDLDAIEAAIRDGRQDAIRPTLIKVRTEIGYASPKQGTHQAHGEPLGADAARATKQALGWPIEPAFLIPDEAKAHFDAAAERGSGLVRDWETLLGRYTSTHPEKAAQLGRAMTGELPTGWDADLPAFDPADGAIATRDAGAAAINGLAARIPTLIGGSADLDPSTKTYLTGQGDFGPDSPGGRNVHFGVREHGMGAIVNGLALHGGVMPFGATFFLFSDYMRPPMRLAALSHIHAIFVFTHDSIALGEDGPTHQPIEQLAGLRSVPGLTVLRPADANETVAAWRVAAQSSRPLALVLTRQKLPVLDPSAHAIDEGVSRGAYLLAPIQPAPDILLLASGSEVHLALEARDELVSRGVEANVVSMPSWELFEQQPEEYRSDLLRDGVPKLSIEAGATTGWHRYVGDGVAIGLERFGASAPGAEVYAQLGFNVANVVDHALRVVARHRSQEGDRSDAVTAAPR